MRGSTYRVRVATGSNKCSFYCGNLVAYGSRQRVKIHIKDDRAFFKLGFEQERDKTGRTTLTMY